MLNFRTSHRAPENFTCLFAAENEHSWDIYQDKDGSLWSFSHNSPKGDSAFGTVDHVIRLMSNGHFTEMTATEAGLKALSGACTALPSDYFNNIELYERKRVRSTTGRLRVFLRTPDFAKPLLAEYKLAS